MCGRFSLHLTDLSRVGEALHVMRSGIEVWEPRFNVAPSHLAPVITGESDRRLAMMAWGFVPHFAKTASKARPINARVETVTDRPMFRDAVKLRRCVVPATGYFEWKLDETTGRKQPHWIHPRAPEDLLYMAGIWAPATHASGETETFAVLTTDAIGAARTVHERMPLALSLTDCEQWLRAGAPVKGFLQSAVDRQRPEALDLREVTTLINTPRNNSPACIAPQLHASETIEDGSAQLDLFASGTERGRRFNL